SRASCWAVCVAVVMAWLPRTAQAQDAHPIVVLAGKLAKPIDFPGIPNGIALRDAMALLSKASGVRIDINERAFELGGVGAAWAPLSDEFDQFLIAAQGGPGPKGVLPGGKPGLGEGPGLGIKPGGLQPPPGGKGPP